MRNPSPPPLTDQEKETISADYIGDTLFSKKWVLGILLQLYKHKQNIYAATQDDSEKLEGCTETQLTQKFEDDMCELWDMSANSDVGHFLHENEIKEVFLDALEKTQSPRLMEICFGIMGNLVCNTEICVSLSSDLSLQNALLSYLSIIDAMSLTELTRILLICVSNKECLQMWLKNFERCTIQLLYILKNSLNVDLLQHVVEILYVLADSSENIIESFLTEGILPALREAYKLVQTDSKILLLQLVQLLSTVNKGVVTLAEDERMIIFLFHSVNDMKSEGFDADKHLKCYSAIFSTFNCILSVKQADAILTLNDNKNVLQSLIDCLRMCNKESEKDDSSTVKGIYLPILFDCLHDILRTILDMKDQKLDNLIAVIQGGKSTSLSDLRSCEFKESGLKISDLCDQILLDSPSE